MGFQGFSTNLRIDLSFLTFARNSTIDASLSWDDFPWLKKVSNGMPIIIKGIHTWEDAVKAHELGARGIFLSNHGGRQVDT